jgi:hypothetical protein
VAASRPLARPHPETGVVPVVVKTNLSYRPD